MKIVCIKNKYGRGLELLYDVTIGKIYDAEIQGIQLGDAKFYTLEKDDNTSHMTYPRELFITLEEHRQNQLDKLI
jgi:hypothetical protein